MPYTNIFIKEANCVKTFLAEKGSCLKTKNLAQIKLVPTGIGGTNEAGHAHQKKDLRKDLQALSKGREKRQRKNTR